MLRRDDPRPLTHAFEGFTDARVVCVGDVMLDQFVYGNVDRVSAEAPIPVLHVTAREEMLGGVGNVARNVVALGAEAVLIAVTGDDTHAARIRELGQAEPRMTTRLIVDPERSSTVKTRFVAEGQQMLRADDESTTPTGSATQAAVIEAIREALAAADVLVLSDYMKGVLTPEVLTAAIAEADAAGVLVLADPKREALAAYAGATVLKPNRRELAQAMHAPCNTDREIEDAARKVIEECGVEAVLVSRSNEGMSLIQRGSVALHLPARAREVVDVSGAGDTVVATAAVALASGAELPIATELANLAAGIVVGKPGTAVTSSDDLRDAMREQAEPCSESKVMGSESALAMVEKWRGQGARIGFTNGCFDLLHPGHVSLLHEARSVCDRLIVAINSDRSVRRLKGEGRPVQQEAARATVLASMGAVDMVIVFDEDTPIPLLELLQPDVLVKGADYTIDQVVGADVVRGYGGEIRLARLVPRQSSTRTIEKLTGQKKPVTKRPPTQQRYA